MAVDPEAASGGRSGDAVAAATPALRIEGLRHSFGSLEVLAGIDLEVGAASSSRSSGPPAAVSRPCSSSPPGSPSRAPGGSRSPAGAAAAARLAGCAYMPQRDLLLPWLRAIDNAALALRLAGSSGREARRTAAPLFERLGLDGFERAWPEAALRRHAPAGRLRPHAADRQADAAPGRALRGARRDHARATCRAGFARRSRAEPRAVVARHPRRRGGSVLADRVVVLSPRPGRPVWEDAVPAADRAGDDRAAVVTAPSFVAAREAALHALGSAGGSAP